MRIYKYKLRITDEQEVLMPERFRALSVGMQGNDLIVWALVAEDTHKIPIKFYVVGTGNPAEHVMEDGVLFVGTVQMQTFVWHVFVMDSEVQMLLSRKMQ